MNVLRGRDASRCPSGSADFTADLTVRRDKDFQIDFWVCFLFLADFGQEKRVHVTARGYEVEIAADSGLGRMEVAKVVSAVDDPKLLVPCREVENLFVGGQNDERGKANLGAN